MTNLPYYIKSTADFDTLLNQFYAYTQAKATLDWLETETYTPAAPMGFQDFVQKMYSYLEFMLECVKSSRDKNGVVELPTGPNSYSSFRGYISPELTLSLIHI